MLNISACPNAARVCSLSQVLEGGGDPAAVLFEPKSVSGHPAPRVAQAEDVARRPVRGAGGDGVWRQVARALLGRAAPQAAQLAGTLTGGARERGGYSHDDVPLVAGTLDSHGGGADENDAEQGRLVAFGGNRTAGARDVASALTAKGGAGRMDFETETFVTVAPAISASNPYGDHEGRHGLLVAHTLRGEGFDASEDGTGRGTPIVPIPFDTTQVTSPHNRSTAIPGAPCHTLSAGAHPPAIAFTCKDHGADAGALAPTLRAMGHEASHANGGGQVAVAGAASGVRRLLPRECERLQGVPDDYTLIPGRSGPSSDQERAEQRAYLIASGYPPDAAEALACRPDGPRYKALGNSKAVPVVRWIGERICAVDPTMRPQDREAAE